MNALALVRSNKYRQTVSGIFYRLGTNDTPLIGIHWPQKAALASESNLSPVAGAWNDNETMEEVITRQLKTEYSVETAISIRRLRHNELLSSATGKQYHWCLVELTRLTPTEKVPKFAVNQSEVAAFGWYLPGNLGIAISSMHTTKAFMFKQVLRQAIRIEPNLSSFRKQFG